VGTAAKPVTLSGATTILSLKPGRVIEIVFPEAFWLRLWVWLLIREMTLFEEL